MKRLTPAPDWPESWRLSHEYDELFERADSRSGCAHLQRDLRRAVLDQVRRAAQPGASVLDVGAAEGGVSLALAELGYEVTWNDIRAELADYVRLKQETGLLRFAPGNLFDLPRDRRYDVVVASEVIEHVAHPDRFLQRLAELVAPAGHVVLSTPTGEYVANRLPRFSDLPDPAALEPRQFRPDADGHLFLLHEDEILRLAWQAGLRVVRMRVLGNPLTCGHLKMGRLRSLLPGAMVSALEAATQRMPEPMRRRLHTARVVLLQARSLQPLR